LKWHEMKGMTSHSTTSYCLSRGSLDSKEPEVAHGDDMRMKRIKTLVEHNQSITEQDNKKGSVKVKTKNIDDNQHVHKLKL